MSHVVDEQVGELLARADAAGSCLVLDADDSGSLRRALARRTASGLVTSPTRGLFADARRWSGLSAAERTLRLARGLARLHPAWVFCGPTAAVLHGLDVSEELLARVHVATTRAGHGPDGPLVTRHALPLPEGSELAVVDLGGVRATDAVRTVFDCLRWTDFARGLGIADSALRQNLVSREALLACMDAVGSRLRGRARVLAALDWADPRSENGGESIARGRMLLLGFARPELQVEVPHLVEGGEPYRVDFCWVRTDGSVVVGELDGRKKYVDPAMTQGRSLGEVLADERLRGSRISLYGVPVMRFGFGLTEDSAGFSALLDEYGVPRWGSSLALPDNVHALPDWESLRQATLMRGLCA